VGPGRSPVRALNRIGIGSDDALIVVSQASKNALPRKLRDRARVVVHGIDLSGSPKLVHDRGRISLEVREELRIPPDEVLVLTVANLRTEKGYDVLLDAASSLSARGVPARLVSVGHGQQAESLQARHTELGLGERFQFLGMRTDVLRLMAGSDVFALPSHFEGLPVTLMEATSVGLPIVATAVGEIPRIFTDGADGLIVRPARASSLRMRSNVPCATPRCASNLVSARSRSAHSST
jgi:glycosyltransferase involved in cell wall biosynthesis